MKRKVSSELTLQGLIYAPPVSKDACKLAATLPGLSGSTLSSLLVNYSPAAKGKLVLPRIGRPVAEVWLEPGSKTLALNPGNPVVLDIEYGPEFIMSVLAAEEDHNLWKLRLVGGSGGLSRPIKAKSYQNCRACDIIVDLLLEVGEIAGEIEPDQYLPQWNRQAGLAYMALEAMMVNFNQTWRMASTGEVWVGQEAWVTYPEVVRLGEAHKGQSKIALAGLEPNLGPGVELHGYWGEFKGRVGRVDRVVHHFDARAWTQV
ncbi:MAG: hypothetical protein C4332_13755, partial [Meiothermus sp.]